MQTLDSSVAATQLADRHAAAAAARAARHAAPVANAAPAGRVVLRHAAPGDASAITGLARLDSAPRPSGDLVVAELDGEIVAAVPVAGGRAIADPFRPTAGLVELLRAGIEPPAPGGRVRRVRPRLPHLRIAA